MHCVHVIPTLFSASVVINDTVHYQQPLRAPYDINRATGYAKTAWLCNCVCVCVCVALKIFWIQYEVGFRIFSQGETIFVHNIATFTPHCFILFVHIGLSKSSYTELAVSNKASNVQTFECTIISSFLLTGQSPSIIRRYGWYYNKGTLLLS